MICTTIQPVTPFASLSFYYQNSVQSFLLVYVKELGLAEPITVRIAEVQLPGGASASKHRMHGGSREPKTSLRQLS